MRFHTANKKPIFPPPSFHMFNNIEVVFILFLRSLVKIAKVMENKMVVQNFKRSSYNILLMSKNDYSLHMQLEKNSASLLLFNINMQGYWFTLKPEIVKQIHARLSHKEFPKKTKRALESRSVTGQKACSGNYEYFGKILIVTYVVLSLQRSRISAKMKGDPKRDFLMMLYPPNKTKESFAAIWRTWKNIPTMFGGDICDNGHIKLDVKFASPYNREIVYWNSNDKSLGGAVVADEVMELAPLREFLLSKSEGILFHRLFLYPLGRSVPGILKILSPESSDVSKQFRFHYDAPKPMCFGSGSRDARWFESPGEEISSWISASVWDRCPPSIVRKVGSYDSTARPLNDDSAVRRPGDKAVSNVTTPVGPKMNVGYLSHHSRYHSEYTIQAVLWIHSPSIWKLNIQKVPQDVAISVQYTLTIEIKRFKWNWIGQRRKSSGKNGLVWNLEDNRRDKQIRKHKKDVFDGSCTIVELAPWLAPLISPACCPVKKAWNSKLLVRDGGKATYSYFTQNNTLEMPNAALECDFAASSKRKR
ncbi:hypothetical protein C0J52_23691 [Blattella germanica]|nr:hypothetical protein C0J52_23691 [Blattella germanica]